MKKKVLLPLFALTYYLSVYKNQIALWQNDQSIPNVIYPVSISVYTQKDQVLLENGINIHSKAELTKHLDDFLS